MTAITQVISDSGVGGAGILLSHITEALKDSFDFEIIVPRASALIDRLPQRGVRITPLSFSPDTSFSPRDVLTFLHYFKKTRPRVIHTHASVSARIAGRLCGAHALLSTRHCAHGARTSSPSRLDRWRERLYAALTTVTVATASAAARELIDEGVKASRIVTLPNGVPPVRRLESEERRSRLDALHLSEDHLILGSCARLEPVKGQDLLLRATARLLPRFPRLRVLLVGDGSCRESLQALAARLGIAHAVRFTGYTKAPDVYQNLFTLNVNTSRGTETTCLATSECMSLGIPTVASDFGGNSEMIHEGKNGRLFRADDVHSLTDTLASVLAHPEALAAMRHSTEDIYRENFSVERMAEGYKSLYLSVSAP